MAKREVRPAHEARIAGNTRPQYCGPSPRGAPQSRSLARSRSWLARSTKLQLAEERLRELGLIAFTRVEWFKCRRIRSVQKRGLECQIIRAIIM